MNLLPPENFRWPPSWLPISPQERGGTVASLEAELGREVGIGHPLCGVDCKAVARNEVDPDDVLFVTSNPQMPLAFVHLTWKAERDPAWPFTVGYAGWDEFRSAWLEEDE